MQGPQIEPSEIPHQWACKNTAAARQLVMRLLYQVAGFVSVAAYGGLLLN
jgi:hypothetical protein